MEIISIADFRLIWPETSIGNKIVSELRTLGHKTELMFFVLQVFENVTFHSHLAPK